MAIQLKKNKGLILLTIVLVLGAFLMTTQQEDEITAGIVVTTYDKDKNVVRSIPLSLVQQSPYQPFAVIPSGGTLILGPIEMFIKITIATLNTGNEPLTMDYFGATLDGVVVDIPRTFNVARAGDVALPDEYTFQTAFIDVSGVG